VNARDVETLVVQRDHRRAGLLTRTTHGARFVYDAEYVASHGQDPAWAVAFTLPVRAEPYEVRGVNLHPFFAGLLPEGLRLRALVRGLKTSEDDLFSLLAAVGEDAVGDVAVTEPGKTPRERSLDIGASTFDQVRFAELLEQSLDLAGGAHASVAGVQPKVSAVMVSFPVRSRLRGKSYLLKLAPPEFPRLVENEAFFMRLAQAAGLEAARVEIVRDAGGESGLLVERFDRVARADGSFQRLHQEDACQLLDRYPADKYRLGLAEVCAALDVCSAPVVERMKLLRLQAFAYAIVNGDLHARNVSVLTRGATVALSPAYDVLSTLPYGDEHLALAFEGRDKKLKAQHFVAFGARVGVRAAAMTSLLRGIVSAVRPALGRLSEIGLDAKATRHLERTIAARLEALDPANG
jgi:serine/threonine-protein kinase HipA